MTIIYTPRERSFVGAEAEAKGAENKEEEEEEGRREIPDLKLDMGGEEECSSFKASAGSPFSS